MLNRILFVLLLICSALNGYALELVPKPNQIQIIKPEVKIVSTQPVCKISDRLDGEEYLLEITKKGKITILGGSEQAIVWARQTLDQILIQGRFVGSDIYVPALRISDKPKFGYRGAMLDCSRHFWTVEQIKNLLDIMSLHKLNVFHWHLTDNQGWRLEIKKYPELTDIGSTRPTSLVTYHKDPRSEWIFDGVEHKGFYTQEQVREIVKYAFDRGIEIIPEIEMPGHSQAALASLPWLGCKGEGYVVQTDYTTSKEVMCAGKETTLEFMKNVLDEVCELFPSKYIHIGGDEAPRDRWKECPHCQKMMKENGYKKEAELQSYLVREVEKYLQTKNRRIIGWDEILEGGVTKTATVMSWRGTKGGIKAAKMGNEVVMTPSTYFYFDYWQTYSSDGEPLAFKRILPLKQTYSFNPHEGLTTDQSKYIIGVQANLWTEYVVEYQHAQRMLLPRLAAMAEIAWAGKATTSYNEFVYRMEKSMIPLYNKYSYEYAPYAFSEDSKLLESLSLSPKSDKCELERQIRKNLPQWKAAIEFIQNNDLLKLSLGRHEITSDGVYANVEEYTSKIESVFEAHRKYIDIQCVVSGEEYIYVTDMSKVFQPLADFDKQKDIQFFKYADGYEKVLADKDNFVVLFPKDAHQPCMAIDGKPGKIRKVVVKVPVK